MNVLNTHIMLGDSFLFIPNLNKLDSNYMGYFPNCNFNKFPEGNNFVDYIKGREMGQFMELNGGYLDINIFLRGGKIIPYQNSDNVASTNDLRTRSNSPSLFIVSIITAVCLLNSPNLFLNIFFSSKTVEVILLKV